MKDDERDVILGGLMSAMATPLSLEAPARLHLDAGR